MNNKNLILIITVILFVFIGFYYYGKTMPEKTVVDVIDRQVMNEIPEEEIKIIPASPEGLILPAMEEGKLLIYYFADGFSPNTLQVPKGASVKFINKSDSAMRIYASNQDFQKYREFNQTNSVGKEGVYEYTFNETGIWPYTDFNNQLQVGNILVY